MLYAKIAVGLPIEGPFDYRVLENDREKIKCGARALISFGKRKTTGYIVGLSKHTSIPDPKTIIKLLDEKPLLDENMLLLTQKLSQYYYCSWGQAIECCLPQGLRKGKIISFSKASLAPLNKGNNREITLIYSLDEEKKWDEIFIPKIKITISNNQSVIILFPDKGSVLKAERLLREKANLACVTLSREVPEELTKWINIKEAKTKLLLGTRSAIFAPFPNLGLIIVENEEAYGYKQDRTPHYHSRDIAFMRSKIEGAGLILSSNAPSLESMRLAKNNKINFKFIPRANYPPEVKIINMKGLPFVSSRKNIIFSKYLEDSISQTLKAGGKSLLFFNRLGFATYAACFNCSQPLKCPRCSANLILHYKNNKLTCHHCNFEMEPLKICPHCKSGYIRYSGAGVEKLESELSRLFPQARIRLLSQEENIAGINADIFIASQSITKEPSLNFNLIGVLSLDQTINQIDFRSTEKAFQILTGLWQAAKEKMIVQTNIPGHACFRACEENNPWIFYDNELKQRRSLSLPPYSHLALIKLRSKKEEKVSLAAKGLFEKLKKLENETLKAKTPVSLNPGSPSKLRGNFYWQILLKSKTQPGVSKFLKTYLKDCSYSGIIITVDMDPYF